jgi:putative tryptophan/tyrosine transport system substrate-binding protein
MMNFFIELVPGVSRVAVLLNPSNAASLERARRDVETAARDMGLQIQVLNASTSREIDAAFTALVRERVDALFITPDGFFNSRRVQLANMAARHMLPITSATREIVDAGGLRSARSA